MKAHKALHSLLVFFVAGCFSMGNKDSTTEQVGRVEIGMTADQVVVFRDPHGKDQVSTSLLSNTRLP